MRVAGLSMAWFRKKMMMNVLRNGLIIRNTSFYMELLVIWLIFIRIGLFIVI